MAQHDYDLANQNGAAFRADLNSALAAIQSQNSGATEPAATVAYMPWADTNAGLWKVRNAADSAWVSVMSLTASRVDTATGTSYDNSGSGLSATTVKDALDELDEDGLSNIVQYSGNKNLIINGNKIINQMGVATNTTNTGDYNFDQWFYDGTYLYQSVEEVNLRNDTFTLSWDSNNTCEYQLLSTATTSADLSTVASGWTEIVNGESFTLSSVSGNHLWLRFTAGSNGLNALTNLQMEKGTIATDFEYRLHSDELELCQKYYWRGMSGTLHNQFTTSAGQAASWNIAFPATMRVTPTVSITNATSSTYSTVDFNTPSKDGARLIGSSSSGSNSTASVVIPSNGYLEADARL